MKFSPDVQLKWRKFRQSKRAWRSLAVLAVMLGLCLPAELLCNARPLVIRWQGQWFFPALKRYTERDFGGTEAKEPDYQSALFQGLLGQLPAAAPAPAGTGGTASSAFDDEPGSPPATSKPPAPPATAAFDEEPGSPPVVSPPATPVIQPPRLQPPPERNAKAAGRTWVLWPPVHYDYQTIATSSRTGRDALAAPFRQLLPQTHEHVPSSWLDGHYLGTDDRGRDVLARLVYGFRVSMLFGLALAVSATFAGIIVGGIQGFFGGWIDLLGQRFTEIWGSLPRLYLLIILSSLLSPNIWILFVILNLTSWMGIAAYMRAEFLKSRNYDYVRAARALGVSGWAIMYRHLLPNSLTPVVTFFPFMITGGILALASLDFLNLGVRSPYPSLGELLAQGQANLHATWIIVPTFLLLTVTITLLTFVGDGIRNAFDPRRQG